MGSSPPQSYEARHNRAIEKLEMGVKMQQAKRNFEAHQRLLEKNMLEAEKRRGATEKAVTHILENPRGWALPVIQNFIRSGAGNPQEVRQFIEKIVEQIDQQHGEELSNVASGGPSVAMTEEDQNMLATSVEECLQRCCELPLQERLIEWCKKECRADDRELIRRQGGES